jgi:mannose-6-phosphate isomerase-like protein (cupin superfamily)
MKLVAAAQAGSAVAPMAGAPTRPTVAGNSERKETHMTRAGDTIENPVTGERLVFRQTAADTDGEAVVFDCHVQPSGFVAKAHVHPYQEELFEVLEGALTFRVNGRELPAGPGDRILVPAGTPHQFWNESETEACFRCEVRPALEFEQLVETLFALARAGKTNRHGLPSPLRLAVIARAHFDTVRLPLPPVWMQRLGLVVGAALGRAVGYQATYDEDVRPAREVVPA